MDDLLYAINDALSALVSDYAMRCPYMGDDLDEALNEATHAVARSLFGVA